MADEKKTRVQCNLPNASQRIGGVYFGVAREGNEGTPAILVSGLVDAATAERLLKIPGYTAASADWDAGDLGRIDASIAQAIENERQARERATPQASRELEEQRRANQAMSEELAALRKRASAAEEKLAKSSVATLEAEIQRQAAQLVEAREKVSLLEKEIAGLRQVNESLVRPASKSRGKAAAA